MTPSKKEITTKIKELLPSIDIQNTGVKQFITLLSVEFGINFASEKDYITGLLTEAIIEHSQNSKNNDDNVNDDSNDNENNDNDDEDRSDQEEDDDEEQEDDSDKADKKRQKSVKRKSTNSTTGSSTGGGLSEPKEISNKLAGLLKKGKTMSRTDVVKSLWEYIRDNNLQNPNNKREIILDTKMKHVFGCTTFTMFTMNKYIGAHIFPFKPVNLDVNTTISKRDKRKGADKLTGKKSKKSKKEQTTIKRKAGTQPPYRLSDALQAVVYEEILPRPQVVSKIWEYIRTNNLQNEKDKREILCDDKLQIVFKKSKVSMFQMNALLGVHFLEKVDKSLYHHIDKQKDDNDDDDDDNNSNSRKGNVKKKAKKQLPKEITQSEGEEEEHNEDHENYDDE